MAATASARRPKPKRRSRHTVSRILSGLLALVALLGVVARSLPSDLQSLPYVPIVVSATPWFAVVAAVALLFAVISLRWGIALLAVACIGLEVWWQYPFFAAQTQLPSEAVAAVAAGQATADDRYARVMTFNVYKGQADPQAIVDAVREERIEVLALQETTDEFVAALTDAGIGTYLPYAQVSSSDGVYGNGLWSATPLADPADDDVNSSASFMPGGTVTLGDVPVRFVSVHTTAPVPGYWDLWRRSLDELAMMRADTGTKYIFMGDFNATTDHTPFRNFLGDRFRDAVQQSGHGFAFTWPTDREWLPRFAGIDHIVVDRGMTTGQCEVVEIAGSDHAALLATVAVS